MVGDHLAGNNLTLEDDGDVGYDVAIWIHHAILWAAISSDYPDRLNEQSRLLLHLSNRRILRRFVGLDTSSWREPQIGIRILDQQDSPSVIADNHGHRGHDEKLVTDLGTQVPQVV